MHQKTRDALSRPSHQVTKCDVMNTVYIAFDLETTGFCMGRKDKVADEILSIGCLCVVGDEERCGEAFSHPGKVLPLM